MSILYPVGALHTRPLVCGTAKGWARISAIWDIVNDVKQTDEQIQQVAVDSFKLFCVSQEPAECLTDDLEALQAMYVDAYEQMYRTRYVEILSNLAKMAR